MFTISKNLGYLIAGGCAGIVNGLFGAGGGMILLPLLTILVKPEEETLFPTSVAIILPLSILSLLVSGLPEDFSWKFAWPYLAGGAAGSVLAGIWGQKIPVSWLHKILGILILIGGIRYLW